MKTPEQIADELQQGAPWNATERDMMIAAIEDDRAQRFPLIEAVADALADRYGDDDDTAAWVRDTDNEDDVWSEYIGPMLDDIREEH